MSRPGVRRRFRDAVVRIARTIGTKIVDPQSGESLGRALVIPWRGKIHVIGLERPLRPFFVPQQRLTYWKQELGFTTHPPPDFPNERSTAPSAEMRNDESPGPTDQR